jgi:hypothetical protein
MPCILVQNIGIIQNQPISYQPFTAYTTTNNTNVVNTNPPPQQHPHVSGASNVSMRGSMAEQVFGLTENVQRWSLDHTPSDNMGNSFKSVDMMGRSGSGISAFTKIDGAPTNQAPGIQINPVQLCKRENRESD